MKAHSRCPCPGWITVNDLKRTIFRNSVVPSRQDNPVFRGIEFSVRILDFYPRNTSMYSCLPRRSGRSYGVVNPASSGTSSLTLLKLSPFWMDTSYTTRIPPLDYPQLCDRNSLLGVASVWEGRSCVKLSR